jgi:hypothetical protein
VTLALALVLGCHDEAREWGCIGPLVELVKWRDQRESARVLGGEAIAPAAMAAEERAHVDAAVAALDGKRATCEMTWGVLMYEPIDNPALRLRDETLVRLLGLPPRDYPAEAVGWAGVTTAGRPTLPESPGATAP